MAYMSDSYFIGTVSRVHNLWRFGPPPKSVPPPSKSSRAKNFGDSESLGPEPTAEQLRKVAIDMATLEAEENVSGQTKRVGMMVSLDHTIYFHRPRDIKADEWLLAEMDSPWAGDGRGLVFQRIWNRKGQLLATCIQEGLCRLEQETEKARL